MTENEYWLNKLFYSYIRKYDQKLYFENRSKLGGKALNLSIHPVRFLDDVFFNFETDDVNLRAKLKKYEVNYDMFYNYADIVKASCFKFVNDSSIKENSLLLVGQTEMDNVVFDGVKYLSLLDYIESIKRVANNYDNIYYKPHPYAKNTKKVFKILKKEFKNIILLFDNIYHILSNDNISHVLGLNSSVLYEAKYFNKEVTFLYKPYFDFSKNDIGIYGDYFSSSFWADILDIECENISLPFTSSRLRKALNDFWGYNQISEEVILKDIVKSKIRYFLSKYVRLNRFY